MSTLKQILIAVALFMPLAGLAQPIQENIELTNDYEPNLSELEKPMLETPNVVPKVETKDVNFESRDIEASTEYEPLKARIPKPQKIKWPALKNNFVKLGYGRFGTPLGQLHLETGRNLNARAGLDLSHISSSRGFVPYAEFRENRGGINGAYFTKTNTLKAHLDFDNVNYFYFADSIVADRPDLKDSIRNTYTRIDFGASVLSNFNPEGINYDVGLGFEGYFDRWQNRELHFSIMPNLNWKVLDNIYADIDAGLIFTTAQFDSVSANRFFLNFAPAVSYKKDRLEATAGVRINSAGDTATTFGAYPILKASYELVEDKLTAQASLLGGMDYTRYYDLIEINRYLTRAPDIRPTRNALHFNVGIEAGFAKYFTASVNGYSRLSKQELIFFNPEGGAYFQMVYDSNFTETGSEIALSFNKENKIRAGIRGHFRRFTTSNIAYNFGIPNTQVDLWGSYRVAEKVSVGTEIFLYGNRVMSVDADGNPINQGFAADANLNADYRFSKTLSIFLELNNLLSTSYSNWYNYPVRPFDVKAGVTLSF